MATFLDFGEETGMRFPRFPQLSLENSFLLLWAVGNIATLFWAEPFIDNKPVYLGFAIFGLVFWAWFARFFIRAAIEFRKLDENEPSIVKAKARIEPLKNLGPEYPGEEAA